MKKFDTGPAEGEDGLVHAARAGDDHGLCGAALIEAVDTEVLPGGWIGHKSMTCIPCISQRMRETYEGGR